MYSGPFGCLTILSGKWAELVQKFVPRNRVGIFPNGRTRSNPLDPKLTVWCVFHTIWVHSEPFGCITKLSTKQDELVQKFVPRSRVGIFRNECTRSTPLDPNKCFGAFHKIWVHLGPFWLTYETRCKTGRTGAKVHAKKSRRNFSQPTHAIHPIGP